MTMAQRPTSAEEGRCSRWGTGGGPRRSGGARAGWADSVVAALGLCGLLGVGLSGCDVVPAGGADLAIAPVPDAGLPGLLEGCTPVTAPCQDGLRCALIVVGEAPFQGYLTQCVPYAPEGLSEDAVCALDKELPRPAGAERKWTDRCGPGLACVPTALRGWRCRPLCALRAGGTCAKGRYCVVPTPVSSVGTCEAPDACQAPAPQVGCPAQVNGVAVGCYALSDSTGGGTYCLPRRMLGGSDGRVGSLCERSSDCNAGLGCFTVGEETRCRPYCPFPSTATDGGVRDMAGALSCLDDLGLCQAVPRVDQVGRCQ